MQRFAPLEELFKGRHFDQEIVVLCVRWYLSFKLSYRDLVAMMAERGIDLAHKMILRWVQHYTLEFEKRWKRSAQASQSLLAAHFAIAETHSLFSRWKKQNERRYRSPQ